MPEFTPTTEQVLGQFSPYHEPGQFPVNRGLTLTEFLRWMRNYEREILANERDEQASVPRACERRNPMDDAIRETVESQLMLGLTVTKANRECLIKSLHRLGEPPLREKVVRTLIDSARTSGSNFYAQADAVLALIAEDTRGD